MVPEITATMRRTTGQNVEPNLSRYIGEEFIGGKRKTHKNKKKLRRKTRKNHKKK